MQHLMSFVVFLAPQEADSRRLLPLKLRVNFNSVLFTKERVDELLAQVGSTLPFTLYAAPSFPLGFYIRSLSKKSSKCSWLEDGGLKSKRFPSRLSTAGENAGADYITAGRRHAHQRRVHFDTQHPLRGLAA